MTAKTIMIQGTMSNAGKSIIAAGLCRIFTQDGYNVAPFKSQNMALNSFITADGGEMGRAQVVQAEACGKQPTVAMNPVLLKPVTDVGSQVIVDGRARAVMTAGDYFAYRSTLMPEIMGAFDSLARANDIVVIEGAGSPAEINLRAGDIVNMGLAAAVDAPVLLVGDIDRGGVFAQLVGTCALLPGDERDRIRGFIVNKFRGDVGLLADGLDELERHTGIPTLGVVPYLNLDIDDEDSLSDRLRTHAAAAPGTLDVAVIRLPKVSNFTDFTALAATPGSSVRYVDAARQLGAPDLLILPGTRNTIADLAWLRANGLADAIIRYAAGGGPVLGICGGYQMLGSTISDPDGVEGGGIADGLSLLPITTRFRPSKHQTRTCGTIMEVGGPLAGLSGASVDGYEIHMGESTLATGATPFVRLSDGTTDGCWQHNVYGTYLHGFFDTSQARQAILAALGVTPIGDLADYGQYRQAQYDHLAESLRASLDLERIYSIMQGQGDGSNGLVSRKSSNQSVRPFEPSPRSVHGDGSSGPSTKRENPRKPGQRNRPQTTHRENRLSTGPEEPSPRFVHVEPADIEATSMAIIESELPHPLDPELAPVIERVIHTTADFDYADTLTFSEGVIGHALNALRRGATIVTDTMMTQAGINKPALEKLRCHTRCFMADPQTAAQAKAGGTTRAVASMDRLAGLPGPLIVAIGNAPTALVRLHDLIAAGTIRPALVIGVPVGFVNVVPAKELIVTAGVPYIVNRGRKGGSTVAAAIVNALLYLSIRTP